MRLYLTPPGDKAMPDRIDQGICPLCDDEAKGTIPETTKDRYKVPCPRCGHFYVTDDVVVQRLVGQFDPVRLSGATRWSWSMFGHSLQITTANIKSVQLSAPSKTDVDAKAQRLLKYIAKQTAFIGQYVDIDAATDWPICGATKPAELKFFLEYLKTAGQVSLSGTNARLEIPGWRAIHEKPNAESSKAFVAMSFSDKPTEHEVDLREAFNIGIDPGIRDAGYNPVRVDRNEFIGDIMDQMLGDIRESRFIVADFTEHRNGVYFEAGFAMGLGLPVIYLCHKADIGKAHFDTNHFNHIVWESAADLRKSLANRIRGTIGKGPLEIPVA